MEQETEISRFDRTDKSSSGNYYRTYAVVDLDAIRYNVSMAKHLASRQSKTDVLVVIKADGYGHGAVEIAYALQDMVQYFGVATLGEAIILRQAGIKMPILILGYTSPVEYQRALNYDITLSVDDAEQMQKIAAFAQSIGKRAKCHVKLNTGMNRLGFEATTENAKCVAELAKLEGIYIEGLFSHFSCADMADLDYSFWQLRQYDDFIAVLEACGCHIPIKHICNSAGIMDFGSHGYDCVRCGIITYGLYPSEEVRKEILPLRPALSWYAHVIHVRNIEAGTAVSYGAAFVAPHPMKIAVVSVGYADGYSRALSSRGRVLIRGCYAPVIGRVCMDQMMVDVTHIPEVAIEDTVTLVGTDGGNQITVEELAEQAGSFSYEFVCGIGSRVTRLYRHGNDILKEQEC